MKHLSSWTGERNLDSPSSGERTGISPNRVSVRPQPLLTRGFGDGYPACGAGRKLINPQPSKSVWKGAPKRVTAPYAKGYGLPPSFPSTTGHVKSCGKMGGPTPKAKYSPTTDSEQVP